jgi:hypothetical protein
LESVDIYSGNGDNAFVGGGAAKSRYVAWRCDVVDVLADFLGCAGSFGVGTVGILVLFFDDGVVVVGRPGVILQQGRFETCFAFAVQCHL